MILLLRYAVIAISNEATPNLLNAVCIESKTMPPQLFELLTVSGPV